MSITETRIDEYTVENIRGYACDGAKILGIEVSEKTPIEVVEAVDSYIYQCLKDNYQETGEQENISLILGCLWGEQLVYGFNWQWADVTFHEYEDANVVGVFSPDRALAIYPFHFIQDCLDNETPVTIMSSYNLLRDEKEISELPRGGYENVHHIAL